jgi:hypothetical protein
MVFNIHNQQAGQINISGRDQYNFGGQQGAVVSQADARAAARMLWDAVQHVDLPPEVRAQVLHDAAAVERDLAGPSPDGQQAAGRLERLTKALSGAGAFAAAGASLIGPLTTLGRWLGPAGSALLGLLP